MICLYSSAILIRFFCTKPVDINLNLTLLDKDCFYYLSGRSLCWQKASLLPCPNLGWLKTTKLHWFFCTQDVYTCTANFTWSLLRMTVNLKLTLILLYVGCRRSIISNVTKTHVVCTFISGRLPSFIHSFTQSVEFATFKFENLGVISLRQVFGYNNQTIS